MDDSPSPARKRNGKAKRGSASKAPNDEVDEKKGGWLNNITGFFCTCTARRFCNCVPLGTGCIVIMGLDFIFMLSLVVPAAFWIQGAPTLAMANGCLLFVGGMLLAGAVFIKERDWANVLVWLSLITHTVTLFLLLIGWIWNLVDWTNCDGTFLDSNACTPVNLITGCCQLGYMFFVIHFVQVINSWRVRNMGGRPLGKIFHNPDRQDPRDVKKANNVIELDAVNPEIDGEDGEQLDGEEESP